LTLALTVLRWALLAVQEAELLSVENSAQIFNILSDVPGDVQDVDELLQVRFLIYCAILTVSLQKPYSVIRD